MSDVPEELRLAARKVFCTDQGAHAFLTAPCPALGGAVPARMVAEGRGAEVLAFLEKLAEVAPPPPRPGRPVPRLAGAVRPEALTHQLRSRARISRKRGSRRSGPRSRSFSIHLREPRPVATADPEAKPLQDHVHCVTQCTALRQRQLLPKPAAHRLVTVLVLVELELVLRHGRDPNTWPCHFRRSRTAVARTRPPAAGRRCCTGAAAARLGGRLSPRSRGLGQSRAGTENPRVGGSIPPPGTRSSELEHLGPPGTPGGPSDFRGSSSRPRPSPSGPTSAPAPRHVAGGREIVAKHGPEKRQSADVVAAAEGRQRFPAMGRLGFWALLVFEAVRVGDLALRRPVQ